MSSSPQTQETERSGTVYMLVVFINQGPTPLMLSKCGTESRFFCAHIKHKQEAVDKRSRPLAVDSRIVCNGLWGRLGPLGLGILRLLPVPPRLVLECRVF